MWKRIKRVVNSNLGRLRDDPLSQGARDLKGLGENLVTVKKQLHLLEQDLRKLQAEEAALGQRIRAALDDGRRDEALELAASVKRVREDQARVQRQLVATRRVIDRAEGLQRSYSGPEPRPLGGGLDRAADETLERFEQELALGDAGGAVDVPALHDERAPGTEKTLGEDSDRVAIDKTIGDSGSGPVVLDRSGERSPVRKTIGPEPAPATVTAAPADADRLVDELERLGRLREQGILSQAEFEQAKRRLLGN